MLEAALEHYQSQQTLTRNAALLAARTWTRGLDPSDLDGSFNDQLGRTLVRLVAYRQVLAASFADDYTDQVLLEQNIDSARAGSVAISSLAGIASDGRPLSSLLYEPIIRIKTSLLGGVPLQQAVKHGTGSLMRIVATQVADAGRVAEGIALTARPAVGGYVRMLTTPSCPRCAILAGKFFRWNSGFARHPRCDCRHIPTSENLSRDLRTDPQKAFEAGQIHGLSAADTKAIQDGADIGQVVNAQRGMYTANAYGRQFKATQEGVTVRGVAGKQLKASGGSYTRTPRPRPEAIYAMAGADRTEALRLLGRFGYLT